MSVTFSNVSFSYGERKIFDKLSVSLPDTGFVVILGKSGSGKTTFLSLLSGTLMPEEGTIDGIDAAMSSVVFQSPLLLDYLPVKDNVMLPLILLGQDRTTSGNIADECLKKTDMFSFRDRFPSSLSGGEQVRVAISRALVKGSPVIILDEPTGMLDEKNSRAIFSLLKTLSENRLVILVTHDEKNGLEIADHLYELKDGKLNSVKKKEIVHSRGREKTMHDGKLKIKDSIFLGGRFLLGKKIRVLISSLFIGFTMCLFYLGLNLKRQMPYAVDELLSEYYSYQETSVSIKETVADNGKLALEKYMIPEKNVLKALSITETYISLDYFLPSGNEVKISQEKTTASFLPVIHQDKGMIAYGSSISKALDVVVNETLLKELKMEPESAIGKTFKVSNQVVLYSSLLKNRDLISMNFDFRITGVSKEKNAFNSSAVYYSYPLMKNRISQIYLPSISEELGCDTTVGDLLCETYYDDDFCSRKLIFLSEDPEAVKEKAEELYGDDVSITSNVLSIKESTTEMISSLTDVAMVFLVIVLISAVLLEFLIVYSLYEDNIRLFALSKVFSAKTEPLRLSFGIQFLLFLMIMLTLFLFSLLLTVSVNTFLTMNALPCFLSGFDAKAFLLTAIIALVCSLVSSSFPLSRIDDKDIKKELEGED